VSPATLDDSGLLADIVTPAGTVDDKALPTYADRR
jgi:hypothetical protein